MGRVLLRRGNGDQGRRKFSVVVEYNEIAHEVATSSGLMLPEIMASHGKLPQLPRDPTNHSDVLGHGCFGSVKFPQSFVRMEFR